MYEQREDVHMDLRGEPVHICVCGSRLWNIQAMFEDYEISMYFTEMQCANCGSLATAPTLVDAPGFIPED
jgi:hypothetical protein